MLIHVENTNHNDTIIDEKYPYITSITLKNKQPFTCVIDNTYNKTICVYHLNPLHTDDSVQQMLSICDGWYEEGCQVPISILFERNGIKSIASPLCRTYNISNTVQINGPVYSFFNKPSVVKKQQVRIEKR
jgi:hypothetical protein